MFSKLTVFIKLRKQGNGLEYRVCTNKLEVLYQTDFMVSPKTDEHARCYNFPPQFPSTKESVTQLITILLPLKRVSRGWAILLVGTCS